MDAISFLASQLELPMFLMLLTQFQRIGGRRHRPTRLRPYAVHVEALAACFVESDHNAHFEEDAEEYARAELMYSY